MQLNNNNTLEATKEKYTPNQLLKKHIYDPHHLITDEELKQLKVGDDAIAEFEKVVNN